MLVSEVPYWFLAGCAVTLGLLFGSFLNVVIYRLPRGESVAHPGSRCPACGTPIRAYDNVPVLSWVVLRGRARCCRAKVPGRYVLVELLGGLIAWAILEMKVLGAPEPLPLWQGGLLFAAYLALGLGMAALAFIDLEHMILPDEITIGGALLGLASLPLRPEVSWTAALAGAAFGFVLIWLPFDFLYSKWRGQAGMGLGDAKLVMLAGAWFGWQGALFTLLAGAVQGTLGAIAVVLAQGKIEEPEAVQREREEMHAALEQASGAERERLRAEFEADPIFHEPASGFAQARLPFGPFLALAVVEFMLFGELLIAELIGA